MGHERDEGGRGGWALVLAFVAILALGPACAGGPPAVEGARPLAYHATVLSGSAVGSAFLLREGIAVTNAHVVAGRLPGDSVELWADGIRLEARLIATSPRMDLALLSLPAGALPVAPPAGAPAPGARVVAAGAVAGEAGPGPGLELAGRVVSGELMLPGFGPGLIVRLPGVRRGFSGGPVLDAEGRLVGMVAALRAEAGAARTAAGAPLVGRDAFVLTAARIRAEAGRLLATPH